MQAEAILTDAQVTVSPQPSELIHFLRQLLTANAFVVALYCGCQLTLALCSWLLVELASAQFGQQTGLFDSALEATHCDFERLVFFQANCGHVSSNQVRIYRRTRYYQDFPNMGRKMINSCAEKPQHCLIRAVLPTHSGTEGSSPPFIAQEYPISRSGRQASSILLYLVSESFSGDQPLRHSESYS